MVQEPYYCKKCNKKHFRGKVYEEHAEFAEGIKITSPVIKEDTHLIKGDDGAVIGVNLPSVKGYAVGYNEGDKILDHVAITPQPRQPECEECKIEYSKEAVDKVMQLQSEDEMFEEIEEVSKMRRQLDLDADAIPEDVKPKKRGLLSRIKSLLSKKN